MYSTTATADSRQIRPGHADLHVDHVHLVDVAADPQACTITWRPVARIRLGGSPPVVA